MASQEKVTPANRRSGEDRRRTDGEPPGKRDRRCSLEPRKPDVIELDMSDSEWSALSEDSSAATGSAGSR
jgi:hypothetical protein